MPSKSKAQQHLMAAAAHNAQFPKARALRASMTMQQLHDFAATKTKSLPTHVKSSHPHKNLGRYLHPKKGR